MRISPKFQEDFPFNMIRGVKEYKFSTGKLNYFFIKNILSGALLLL